METYCSQQIVQMYTVLYKKVELVVGKKISNVQSPGGPGPQTLTNYIHR
jgi:hypothetical protein